MSLFLLFLVGTMVAGWLVRDQPYRARLVLAVLAALALTIIYYGLERFI